MNEHLHNLIESLREELKQYGELLALLNVQQDGGVRAWADELLEKVRAISDQGENLRVAGQERAQRLRDLAQSLGLAEDLQLAALLPSLASAHRPLVTALLEENNQLLVRVRQRAQQNHFELGRSLDLMEKFILSLGFSNASAASQTGVVTAPAAARLDARKGPD